jgi:aldehyde dehydrogenase (NAD+)
LIHESGSTRIKAEIEWQMLYAITLEAASFPHRASGHILPSDDYGKQSDAYRQPVRVLGVISPWNFPIYLSHCSVGPALALGNAVVVKPSQDTPVTGALLIAKIYEEGLAFANHRIPALISFSGSTAVATRPFLPRSSADSYTRVIFA